MSNCMPKEQQEYLKNITSYMLEATNMSKEEAESFAFRLWQFKDSDKFKKIAFDNPPLKFEELEEGTWVWDNSVYEKSYAQIKRKFMCGDDLVVAMKQDEGECEDGDDYLGRVFEDNRFYHREVLDND